MGHKGKVPKAPFLYCVIKADNHLLSFLMEAIHAYPALRGIFDPEKCVRFINGVKSGNRQTNSLFRDAEVIGSLASICYLTKCIDSL